VCIECGTCVLICPTGAITLADITGNHGGHAAHTWESQWAAADCRVCGDFYQEQQLFHVPGVLAAAQEAV
jgi:Fe-S-cluster-containing hydrogenase component 2